MYSCGVHCGDLWPKKLYHKTNIMEVIHTHEISTVTVMHYNRTHGSEVGGEGI